MPLDTVPELLPVRIAHTRMEPQRNAFSYRALYVVLPVSALKTPPRRVLFSFEGFGLFGFHARDHGDGGGRLEAWVRGVLRRFGHEVADGEIWLVTLPRILGFVFNPVSFWLCTDRAGALRAVIAEVNNTFGERHLYFCGHEDGRTIGPADWLETEKIFHVSPFLPVAGHYRFRFALDGDRIGIFINHYESNRLCLATSLEGKRTTFSSGRLLREFAANPLIAIKVIGLIHWQALKLVMRGLTYRTKPRPPDTDYSR